MPNLCYKEPETKHCPVCGTKAAPPKYVQKTSYDDTGAAHTRWTMFCSSCNEYVDIPDLVEQGKASTTPAHPKPDSGNPEKIGLRDMWITSIVRVEVLQEEAINGLKRRCERAGIPERFMVLDPILSKKAPTATENDEAFRLTKSRYEKEHGSKT